MVNAARRKAKSNIPLKYKDIGTTDLTAEVTDSATIDFPLAD